MSGVGHHYVIDTGLGPAVYHISSEDEDEPAAVPFQPVQSWADQTEDQQPVDAQPFVSQGPTQVQPLQPEVQPSLLAPYPHSPQQPQETRSCSSQQDPQTPQPLPSPVTQPHPCPPSASLRPRVATQVFSPPAASSQDPAGLQTQVTPVKAMPQAPQSQQPALPKPAGQPDAKASTVGPAPPLTGQPGTRGMGSVTGAPTQPPPQRRPDAPAKPSHGQRLSKCPCGFFARHPRALRNHGYDTDGYCLMTCPVCRCMACSRALTVARSDGPDHEHHECTRCHAPGRPSH